MNFETIIGLEVHVELKTNSKIFCSCSNAFGAEPNSNTCPVCLGHPGVLPVLNREAVNFAVKAAMALNCEIAEETKFDRKNYFYPDNPKAYQISQFDQPIGENGWIDIHVNGQSKRIGITRLHLEEDAGKLTHMEEDGYSLVDYNRVGTPLVEIVSEPDIESPEEAYAYLEKLKAIMQYTEVSDCKMEEGSLRCDANISLRPKDTEPFGTKTELKNLNSFTHVQKGLAHEEERQAEVLNEGGEILQETRRWDEGLKKTILMRVKEGSDDYRYFPDPDLVKLNIDEAWKESIRKQIPELPDARQKRYIETHGLPAYDAEVITKQKAMSDFFEEVLAEGGPAKQAANWLMGEVNAYLNQHELEMQDVPLTPKALADMINMIEKGTISSKIAKQVFKELIENGGDPETVVKEKGLVQISDDAAIRAMVNDALDQNPQSVEDYQNGKDKAIGFLVGQVMKASRGKANPQMVNELLTEEIKKR
ncbi:Asp-tRNA(Asn)/Glu-tRNA(Gln) amidotransferase subunit GatB [Salisediminibacterium halotolerans]|uniref:Aspartyl/glutamyl-tRNA(Asn/Gln) amidotransferase subunit B n=1 Tax=Salisediminibacterium halotolerans TaxID=517425 RepID=A0A1H9VW72_9BACI|nr:MULTISPECIES: Asp-tRNA(Asn)/Glu-tRNA(Gln) amidotransferase subunit GatB [Salisediminibacterium]RLJ71781.1 aspartyl/glutamyl-tRNA(Asn/Gln) amidotransferase subunit B [Actinophytocola xinjiangensis]RPE86931.1 aspartyl/glutamyl-tRNA(Asn/Gln) amidotransferase subunit B [Salisediminibacterium halotolerans]TWG32994.1 aspartyl/glutamyl-tRNA(Asn/Gln) amidotransferase subunit B [Salisediminibacterium halotolerans]SES25734.1 aspartyl-tRNA(Asn)/glutamyl-tRNA(Gln) amidotransferase subunit B [Salisedimin